MNTGKIIEDQSLVQTSLSEIFRLNGYNDPDLMTQRSFEHISSEIEKKSGIVISGTTVRRLSKGAFNRSPQIATLNAIANYFDFSTWQEYKISLTQNRVGTAEATEVDNNKSAISLPSVAKKANRKIVPFGWMVLILGTISTLAFYFYPDRHRPQNFGKANFHAEKITDNDLP